MTEQQLVAIESPCRVAEDCVDSRFFRMERLMGQEFSVGLTLNIGYE